MARNKVTGPPAEQGNMPSTGTSLRTIVSEIVPINHPTKPDTNHQKIIVIIIMHFKCMYKKKKAFAFGVIETKPINYF